MFKYAQEKTGELWGGVRGDMLVTLITLIAAYVASSYDWLRLRAKFDIGNEISIIVYFIFAGIALIAGTFFWHFLYSISTSWKIELDLEFSTKPGRKIFGRYLGMYIYNKSAANIESCSVILKDVKAVGKNWNPPEAINREDALLWGSKMRDREGKKAIRRNNDDDTLVDILHTSDKQKGGRIYFTQQHVGEIISARVGAYHIDLAIRGSHLGESSIFPSALRLGLMGVCLLAE